MNVTDLIVNAHTINAETKHFSVSDVALDRPQSLVTKYLDILISMFDTSTKIKPI